MNIPHVLISFGLKFGSMALGFLVTLILARILPTEQLGLYSLAMSIVMIGSILVSFGLPEMALREYAKQTDVEKWDALTNFRHSALAIFPFSIITACLLYTSPSPRD